VRVPGFPRPPFPYTIDVARERRALRRQKRVRKVPARDDEHVLLGTWNIANLGAPDQVREAACFDLLAEIVGWFDLVALQEIRDNIDDGVRELHARLPRSWRLVFSEDDGNHERMAFLWDSDVVRLGELIGKAVVEPKSLRTAGGPQFKGFSRTPYVGTFHRGELALMLVSVHSYFGDPNDPKDMRRRLAETRAIGWWSEAESRSPHAYTKDIVAVGDFNTPSEDDMATAAAMLKELRRHGLHTPRWTRPDGVNDVLTTQLGSAVRSENHYDQLLFFPQDTESDLVAFGVFDFDATIFADLWEARGRADFNAYTVWAISDHRPLWGRFTVP
jgi:hypothetical protein